MRQLPTGVPNATSRNCIPLMPSDTLICIFPALTPQVTDAHVNTHCCRRGMGFFSSIMHTWECIYQAFTHTIPFPSRSDNCPPVALGLCHLRGRGDAGKVPLTHANKSRFTYKLLIYKTNKYFFLFSSNRVLEHLLWKPGFLQRLSHPWVSAQVSVLQVLPGHS